ncbi:MAG: hypothetical protein JSU57_00845 [Candidatus Heimdallarchaeota archaeon]|nr:MAG: hypothetical protein JSU57_00845 [Candidatus Heimdallarchaeota archaeon]
MIKDCFNKRITIRNRKERIFFLIGVVFILSFSSKGIFLSISNANLTEVQEFTSVDIPMIELGTPFQGTFSREEIDLGRTVLYFYVDIDQPGVYELSLTMSQVVYTIDAEFMSIIDFETSFGNFQIPQILDSEYFYNSEEVETITEPFFLLQEFDNSVGLSLSIYFDETASADRDYEVEITEQRISEKSTVNVKFNQDKTDVSEYFSLDLGDLGVSQAGFYNLSTFMTAIGTTDSSYDEYDGSFRVRSVAPMNWYYYSSIYFEKYYYEEGYQEDYDFSTVYLDPDQNYYFEASGYCWMDEGVQEISVTCQFDAKRVSSTKLGSDDSVDVLAGQDMLVEVEIPTEDGVKITVDHSDTAEYRLNFLTQFGSSYYYTFGNFTDDYYYSENEKNWRTLSYIQLAQREVDQDILEYRTSGYSPMGVYDYIIMGGLVSIDYYEYRNPGYYVRYQEEYQTSLISLPLASSGDSLYLSVRSDEDITLESRDVPITDLPVDGETIDLLNDDDPLRMYEIDVSSEDSFIFEVTSELETTSSAISEADSVVEQMYQDNEIQVRSQMLLPGYPFPIESSYGFQFMSLKEGTGLFVFSPGYRIYRRAYLESSDPDAYNVNVDDIKVEIEEASIEAKLVQTKVPETDDLIDIRLNISQPIQFFTFPVDEGAVYNLTIECLPFRSYTFIFITDIEGDNPFYNLEAFTTIIGQTGYLVGRKDTKAYIIIVGDGPVRIHLKKVGSGGKIKSEQVSAPAFELYSVLLILPILVIFRQKRRK